MNKFHSTNKPKAIELLDTLKIAYRWNIAEEPMNTGMTTNLKQKQYAYNEVQIEGVLSSEKLKEVVINSIWGNGVEQKLINDYNSAVLGLQPKTNIDKYKEFLKQREEIKIQIDLDVKTYLKNK